jgi:hypothetical protein
MTACGRHLSILRSSSELQSRPGRCRPPPVGFVTLPSTCRCASTPAGSFDPTSASEVPLESLVPPSWFHTTSTVSSARTVAGLLHPAADLGFAAFPDGPTRDHRCRWAAPSPVRFRCCCQPRIESIATFLATRFRAPRRTFPLHSRTTLPWPLPPCCFDSFEALLRGLVRSAFTPVAGGGAPEILPGLAPLRGLLRSGSAVRYTVGNPSVGSQHAAVARGVWRPPSLSGAGIREDRFRRSIAARRGPRRPPWGF